MRPFGFAGISPAHQSHNNCLDLDTYLLSVGIVGSCALLFLGGANLRVVRLGLEPSGYALLTRELFGGDGRIRTYSLERTALQAAATLQLSRIPRVGDQ